MNSNGKHGTFPPIDAELRKYIDRDRELVAIAEEFKMLSLVEWPKRIQSEFLNAYKRGNPVIPQVTYPVRHYTDALKKLEKIIQDTDTDHPIAKFIHQNAKSYWLGHQLVEKLGQPEMLNLSVQIYGQPSDIIAGSQITALEAAKFFVEIAQQFDEYFNLGEQDICVLADTIRDQLQQALESVITDDKVTVVVDENLVPKAAAGVSRIRLRSGTCFSPFDFKQLLEHEVFVHTLTAINGRHQMFIKSLGLGSPRTTATQEGLATFAELITGAIDLNRLKRIALRVIATDMAIRGANFIEVFKFFLEHHQSESESYSSTQRIFRGGDPNGRIVFTKDNVYLDGLLRAHSFFRWAMKSVKMNLTKILFAGRMTFDDPAILEPFVESGLIQQPKYIPPWLSQIPTLGGYLAFSLFANKIRVGGLDKEFQKPDSPT